MSNCRKPRLPTSHALIMVHDEDEAGPVALRGSLSIDGEKVGERHLLAFRLQLKIL